MRNQGQLILGVLVITIGAVFLIGNILDVNVWTFCWPVGLIGLGVWLLVRPRMVGSDTAVRQKLIGDVRIRGDWQVADEEFWVGIGDVRLDMTDAEIPLGETRIRTFGFVGDITLRVPQDVGVSVSTSAFISEVKGLGKKRESFLTPIKAESDNYKTAERKINVDAAFFVGDVKIRQV